jgi:hypothetical protein
MSQTAEVRQAILDSVAHWERMMDGEEGPGEDPRSESCALCQMCKKSSGEATCDGCPVSAKTGLIGCAGTPWDTAYRLWQTVGNRNDPLMNLLWKVAAQKMVDFLKGLLEIEKEDK